MISSIGSIGTNNRILGSALQSNEIKVAATAVNIANADTPGYGARSVQMVSTAPGVRAVVDPTSVPVNLTSELVNLKTASMSYEAAAKAFGSISRTEKHAIDTIG